jgi:hypothetical protein
MANRREYQREYRKKHKEETSAYDARYYIENKRKITSRSHNYYKKNKEIILAKQAEYRQRHSEEIVAGSKKYYEEHKKERCSYGISYYKEKGEEIRAKNREYHRSHKENGTIRGRRGSLKRDHGLTLEEYSVILVNQGGICAICGGSPNGRHLAVDHDHSTGKIRGFLCTKCNTMLGSANDSTEILISAINYLQKVGKKETK